MLTIKIKTDNAAFHLDCNGRDTIAECARILRHIADRLERGQKDGPTMDANGSTVGTYRLTNR